MEIEQYIGGFTKEQEAIVIYKMINSRGESVTLSNLGAGILSINVNNKNNKLTDVVLGYKNPMDYMSDSAYMGKTLGRFAGKISAGRFNLEGKEYFLKLNFGRDHLNGGMDSFSERLWLSSIESDRVVFQLTSPDNDQGYPGELIAEVSYSWDEQNELSIELLAQSNKTTKINLSNLSYFNLSGKDSDSVLNHTLENQAIEQGQEYFKLVEQSDQLKTLAKLHSPLSGITMTLRSTHHGVSIETGNYLQGLPMSKNGKPFSNNQAVALSALCSQESESTIIKKDERYRQIISYKFSLE